ncbi:MAG: hypothetical protein U0R64_05935 [Candidatus Nanopelagicales bacterium]
MNRIASLTIAGAAGAALVLTGTTVAQAKINPGVGIAGVKIGQSKKTVIRKKGQPDHKESMQVETLGTVKMFYYGTGGKNLTVELWNNHVIQVSTQNPSQVTNKDIGVGSRKSDLVVAYPDANCERVTKNKQICQLGEFQAGNIITTFRLTKKVIKEVEVAQFLD